MYGQNKEESYEANIIEVVNKTIRRTAKLRKQYWRKPRIFPYSSSHSRIPTTKKERIVKL